MPITTSARSDSAGFTNAWYTTRSSSPLGCKLYVPGKSMTSASAVALNLAKPDNLSTVMPG